MFLIYAQEFNLIFLKSFENHFSEVQFQIMIFTIGTVDKKLK